MGQVARLDEGVLIALLGRAVGRHLHALAHNRDPRPIQSRTAARVDRIPAGCRTPAICARRARPTLIGLVDRSRGECGWPGRIGARRSSCLRFGDYSRATRSHTLPLATSHTETILVAARGLLAPPCRSSRSARATLVGISVANLQNDDAVQLVLPFDRRGGLALDTALDEIRRRFGTDAVTRAVLLGRSQGFEVPLLIELQARAQTLSSDAFRCSRTQSAIAW